jgi:hypothetical protein
VEAARSAGRPAHVKRVEACRVRECRPAKVPAKLEPSDGGLGKGGAAVAFRLRRGGGEGSRGRRCEHKQRGGAAWLSASSIRVLAGCHHPHIHTQTLHAGPYAPPLHPPRPASLVRDPDPVEACPGLVFRPVHTWGETCLLCFAMSGLMKLACLEGLLGCAAPLRCGLTPPT